MARSLASLSSCVTARSLHDCHVCHILSETCLAGRPNDKVTSASDNSEDRHILANGVSAIFHVQLPFVIINPKKSLHKQGSSVVSSMSSQVSTTRIREGFCKKDPIQGRHLERAHSRLGVWYSRAPHVRSVDPRRGKACVGQSGEKEPLGTEKRRFLFRGTCATLKPRECRTKPY